MEEFHNQIGQLRFNSEQLENVDISHFIKEIEQIGQQLKSSQDFLLIEIQRLKKDLDFNYAKLNYANELRSIDEKTLKSLKTKFQDLTEILSNVKKKELNAYQIVQILRVNTSRLWQILETAVGFSATENFNKDDLEKFLHTAQIEKDERSTCLTLLEKEHGDLLVKMKEIQLSLEHFRTSILQITNTKREIRLKIKKQQKINEHMNDQSTKRLNSLLFNTKDVQLLLIDYKFLMNEMYDLVKLIYQMQNQIEIHHKKKLIYDTKLEKFKQDLTLNILNRTNYEYQVHNLQRILHKQNENFQQLENQQKQIIKNRQELHRQIDTLESEKIQVLNTQKQLIDMIKQSNVKNTLLTNEAFQINHNFQHLQHSYRKFVQNYKNQQNVKNNLQKSIQISDQRVEITKSEINKLTEQIKKQNNETSDNEIQLDFHTKEFQDLENCSLMTQNELIDQRSQVNESKGKVQVIKQKLHKFMNDEKPLAKEISQYQKQLKLNETNYIHLELNLKNNESKIHQYKKSIGKLILNSKQNETFLIQETFLLEKSQQEIEQSKENIKNLNTNLKHSENNYRHLKEAFLNIENENKLLKQEYEYLTFLMKILGHKQATIMNNLTPLYKSVKHVTQQHVNQIKQIEQSKSDLNLLHKYYASLRSYNHQLHQSVLLKSSNISTENQVKRQMKIPPNHIHYLNTIKSSSPDRFNSISKLFLLKKKIVHKTDELKNLKRIFHEKEILYGYLNQIHSRRVKLLLKSSNTID